MARVAFPTTPFGTKSSKWEADPASEKLIAWKVSRNDWELNCASRALKGIEASPEVANATAKC